MRTEETFIWRVKWIGKWSNTRFHCTEEFIRKEHPEAVKVEGSLRVFTLPETPEEFRSNTFNPSTGEMHPDGSHVMLWEQGRRKE